MWTDLVKAYESKIAVLEEARRAYLQAIGDVTKESREALESAVREVFSVSDASYRLELPPTQSADEQAFSGAPWAYVSIIDEAADTECRISTWVASCFGGPEATLRVAISLEAVRLGLDPKEWTSNCAASIPDSAPGEPYDPLSFPDIASDRPIMRVVSLPLGDLGVREVGEEVRNSTRTLIELVVPMLEHIGDAAQAMLVAERALVTCRPTVEAKAEGAGAQVVPNKGLGLWQGGKFLQVGDFWIRALPTTNELIVECNPKDEAIVVGLAQELGRPTARSGGRLHFVLLTEGQLRDSDHDVEAAISAAFDYWFHAQEPDVAPRPD